MASPCLLFLDCFLVPSGVGARRRSLESTPKGDAEKTKDWRNNAGKAGLGLGLDVEAEYAVVGVPSCILRSRHPEFPPSRVPTMLLWHGSCLAAKHMHRSYQSPPMPNNSPDYDDLVICCWHHRYLSNK